MHTRTRRAASQGGLMACETLRYKGGGREQREEGGASSAWQSMSIRPASAAVAQQEGPSLKRVKQHWQREVGGRPLDTFLVQKEKDTGRWKVTFTSESRLRRAMQYFNKENGFLTNNINGKELSIPLVVYLQPNVDIIDESMIRNWIQEALDKPLTMQSV